MVRGRGTLTKSWHLNSVSIYRMKCLLLSWKAAKKFDGGHRTGNWTKRPDNNLQKELKVHYVVSYVLSFCVETQPQGVFVFHHLDPPPHPKKRLLSFLMEAHYTHAIHTHLFFFCFFESGHNKQLPTRCHHQEKQWLYFHDPSKDSDFSIAWIEGQKCAITHDPWSSFDDSTSPLNVHNWPVKVTPFSTSGIFFKNVARGVDSLSASLRFHFFERDISVVFWWRCRELIFRHSLAKMWKCDTRSEHCHYFFPHGRWGGRGGGPQRSSPVSREQTHSLSLINPRGKNESW